MKVLSLFAGMGGFDLGFELAGFDVVAQVEIEPYCKQVLKYNFPTAKQYGDIREVAGEQILRDCGTVEIICGGFPCQDISHAGKGAGLDGERSGLWWEMHRLIRELRPTWVVAENVDALRNRGLNRVVASLEDLGYKVWCFGIPASALGATHQRKRLWIVAYCNSVGCKLERKRWVSSKTGAQQGHNIDGCSTERAVGHSKSERQREPHNKANAVTDGWQARSVSSGASALVYTDSDGIRKQSGWRSRTDWSAYSPFNFPVGPGQQQHGWEEPRTIESSMGVTAYGLPRKLALRAIGNSIVPAIAYSIARTIGRMERVSHNKSGIRWRLEK